MTDVARDASPVAFYRRLAPDGEPELIQGIVAPGAGDVRFLLEGVGHEPEGSRRGC